MTRTSMTERSVAELARDEANKQQWLIVGGGRLGRGVLGLIADAYQLQPYLFVAGHGTPQQTVDRFNELQSLGTGYSVVISGRQRSLGISDYRFATTVDSAPLIDAIAHPKSVILSTSVGLRNLPSIAPLIAYGLRRRADLANEALPLLILACENGRGPNDLSPGAWLSDNVQKELAPYGVRAETVAVFPQVVVDIRIPVLPGPNEPIPISSGTLWIEDLPAVSSVLQNAELGDGAIHIELASSDDISILQTRKLYAFNSLHCIACVIGQTVGFDSVDMVIRSVQLQDTLAELKRGLVAAICQRHGIDPTASVCGESTETYVERVASSLSLPVGDTYDPVNRGISSLRNGWYLSDGRIWGPLEDLKLFRNRGAIPRLSMRLRFASMQCLKTSVPLGPDCLGYRSRTTEVCPVTSWLNAWSPCTFPGPKGVIWAPSQLLKYSRKTSDTSFDAQRRHGRWRTCRNS